MTEQLATYSATAHVFWIDGVSGRHEGAELKREHTMVVDAEDGSLVAALEIGA